MNGFLRKQGQYVLQKEGYAYLLTALMVFLPFTAWLAVAVMALVTLRNGSLDGLKVALVGLLATLLAAQLFTTAPYTTSSMLLTFVVCYGLAVVLRVTASWDLVGLLLVSIAILFMALVHWLAPTSILEQFNALIAILTKLNPDSPVIAFLSQQSGGERVVWANYTLGIRAFSVVCSVLTSLVFARFMQSLLFYPGGLRKEMLAFRATRIGALLLIVTAIGVWKNNALAISCLPVLVAYLTAAGMSLLCYMMPKKNGVLTILLLFVPLIIIPYLMLPVYAILGSLDSLFNFRLHLPSKADDTENKG